MFDGRYYNILIDYISLFEENRKKYDEFIKMLYNLFKKYNLKDGCAINSFKAENQRCLILSFDRNFNDVLELYNFFNKFVKELKKKDKNNLVVNISLYDIFNVTAKYFKNL